MAANPDRIAANLASSGSHDFLERMQSSAGNRGFGRWIQAKLRIGPQNDMYEQEADAVAERVTQTERSRSSRASSLAGHSTILRKSMPCDEGKDREARPKRVVGAASASPFPFDPPVHLWKGTGEPLSPALRSYFEPRMAANFGSVRIHRDAVAVEAAQNLNARAFTVGENIVFGPAQYSSESVEGRKLLAHELTHVMQQSQPGADSSQTIRRSPDPGGGPNLTVKGDPQRTSPSGGVQLGKGVLTWNEQYKGIKGSVSEAPGGGLQIGEAIDVQMDVEFTPSPDLAKKCPTITFLQTVNPTVGGVPDVPRLLFTRDVISGSSADVRAGETEPFYGIGPGKNALGLEPDMGSSTTAGSAAGRSAKASFADAPVLGLNFIPRGQKAVREFEVAPICAETGQTFGSIKWGYTKTSAGEIELTGGQPADVKTGSATPQLENVRQAFYSGFFQYSIPNFGRGSHALTSAHKKLLAQVLASGAARKFVLVGANDFSGGPENDASLSLHRAEAVQNFLIQQGIPADRIEVQGHGVEARVPNRPGDQQPRNRRVDIHIDRGKSRLAPGGEFHNPVGGAKEYSRFRRQDPRETFEELGEFLRQLQTMTRIPTELCNQLTNMVDGVRRARALDRSVPDVDEIYGPTIRGVRRRCIPLIDRPAIDIGPTPLQPPNFIHQMEESVEEAGI